MPKTKIILLGVMFIVIIGAVGLSLYTRKNTPVVAPIARPQLNEILVYTNSQYGFTFNLPVSWAGYQVLEDKWVGNTLAENTKEQSGPKLILRNPKWTKIKYYEDIPILVFTTAQWDGYTKEEFAVSAAPISAREMSRNAKYVFALPPRWDFDYSEGFQEAEDIVNSNPLKGFDK